MTDPRRLAEKMAEKPDQELFAIFATPDDWTAEALSAAKVELCSRGIDPERPDLVLAMSEPPNSALNAAQEAAEEELCTQCMASNLPGSHFCRECGAPLSSFAATGPFERLFAEGHVYRKAVEQPQRFIVVLGVWLIFGFMVWIGAMIAITCWGAGSRLGVLAGIAIFGVSALMIVKTTKNYRSRRVPESEDNG